MSRMVTYIQIIFLVPYDDNCVRLHHSFFQLEKNPQSSSQTNAQTNYFNASRVKLPGQSSYTFLATQVGWWLFSGTLNFISNWLSQAPQPSSFDHFWHLVIQNIIFYIFAMTFFFQFFQLKAIAEETPWKKKLFWIVFRLTTKRKAG